MTRAIPAEQCATVGANIRALRQRNDWTQARLGELMGWPTTACLACGAAPGSGSPATTALTRQARPGHAAVSR